MKSVAVVVVAVAVLVGIAKADPFEVPKDMADHVTDLVSAEDMRHDTDLVSAQVTLQKEHAARVRSQKMAETLADELSQVTGALQVKNKELSQMKAQVTQVAAVDSGMVSSAWMNTQLDETQSQVKAVEASFRSELSRKEEELARERQKEDQIMAGDRDHAEHMMGMVADANKAMADEHASRMVSESRVAEFAAKLQALSAQQEGAGNREAQFQDELNKARGETVRMQAQLEAQVKSNKNMMRHIAVSEQVQKVDREEFDKKANEVEEIKIKNEERLEAFRIEAQKNQDSAKDQMNEAADLITKLNSKVKDLTSSDGKLKHSLVQTETRVKKAEHSAWKQHKAFLGAKKEATDEKAELQKKLAALKEEQAHNTELVNAASKTHQKLKILEETNSELQQNKKITGNSLKMVESKLSEEEKKLKNANANVMATSMSLAGQQVAAKKAEEALRALQSSSTKMQKELHDKETTLAETLSKLEKETGENNKLQTKLSADEQKISGEEKELKEVKATLSTAQEQVQSEAKTITERMELDQRLNAQYKQTETEGQRLAKELADAKANASKESLEVSAKTIEVVQKRAEIMRLTSEVSEMKATLSKNAANAEKMQAKLSDGEGAANALQLDLKKLLGEAKKNNNEIRRLRAQAEDAQVLHAKEAALTRNSEDLELEEHKEKAREAELEQKQRLVDQKMAAAKEEEQALKEEEREASIRKADAEKAVKDAEAKLEDVKIKEKQEDEAREAKEKDIAAKEAHLEELKLRKAMHSSEDWAGLQAQSKVSKAKVKAFLALIKHPIVLAEMPMLLQNKAVKPHAELPMLLQKEAVKPHVKSIDDEIDAAQDRNWKSGQFD